MSEFREARVDLTAIAHNIRTIKDAVGVDVLAVVKANAYGHGAPAVARAALQAGASWLGVVDVSEARALREAGIDASLIAWMHDPDSDFRLAADLGIDVGLSHLRQLEAAADAGVSGVQLKVDTGLRRNGSSPEQWSTFFARAAELEAAGAFTVRGIFSHLSNTTDADDLAQVAEFERAIAVAESFGLNPRLRHIAATGAALTLPQARFTMVRIGIGMYGLSPFDDRSSAQLGLHPAMRLSAKVAMVKRVPADLGISYGYLYRTPRETTLALIPLGYADGLPRVATEGTVVQINGVDYPVAGRIAMDQCVVDVGDAPVAIGDEAVLWGDPERGEPAVEQWARAAHTINYEIVARLGARPVRVYVDD